MSWKFTDLPYWLLIVLIAGLLSLPSGDAQAARTCRMGVSSLAFGQYTPATPTPVDSAGSVRVLCWGRPSRGQPSFYVLRIDGGSSGNPASRSMLAGSLLYYNLYKNASRTDIWGDGTAGTTPLIQNLPGQFFFFRNHAVYGRVSAGQDPVPGVYSDIPMVTIEF